MNTTQLKTYAPQARTAFIAAVTAQAARYGVTAEGTDPVQVEGDIMLVGGQAYPKALAKSQAALADRVKAHGFAVTMEAVAYTWFNRFAALRYMELHGYLDHGYRVLSHPAGQPLPEILERATDVELSGLDKPKVIELKLDGKKDEELYRLLLKAQCNALHKAMPFLFEEVGAADELLLPANLLHTDSLIRQLVEQVDEDLWQDIEIIGWLYQFYISEKKAQVIGKVVKSEDIPAATQLFTPNWIVKYMVQNSLGAQWLATYPDSPLKQQMEYYIEPAEQIEEVNAQLAAITPSQLNPEELTLIDPASGSGHILVEAYDLFKAIYLERGYRQRNVPQLILEKNLFGLDIDERAAQLTGFALMMKGRADDRRLFGRGVKLNVMALVDSQGLNAVDLHSAWMAIHNQQKAGDAEPPAPAGHLFETEDDLYTRAAIAQAQASRPQTEYALAHADIAALLELFEHATTFGSLIQVPEGLASSLPALKQLSEASSEDLFVSEALKRLGPLVQQAELLAAQYDSVVANPPYMGSKGMNVPLKKFAKDFFADSKSDLFSCFIERGYGLAKHVGRNAMVTMQSWMFLASFEKMRERTLREKSICTMAHLGARAFGSISGEVVQTAAFVLQNLYCPGFRPVFFRLLDGGEKQKRTALAASQNRFDSVEQQGFQMIPGSPLAYWASPPLVQAFEKNPSLSEKFSTAQGMKTLDNERFVREWSEVPANHLGGITSHGCEGATWFPINHGGEYRRWFGNNESVLNWKDDGAAVKALAVKKYNSVTRTVTGMGHYFKPGLTWTSISSSSFGVRQFPSGYLFTNAGMCAFGDELALGIGGCFLNSNTARCLLEFLSPTLNFGPNQVKQLPFPETVDAAACRRVFDSAVSIAKADWNAYERSWDFQSVPLRTASLDPTSTLESSYTAWISQNRDTIAEMKCLEEKNNRLFIDAYGLADELTPDVPIEQITLTVNPAYRYGGKLTEEEQWTRFRQDTMEELVSCAIGCMMGRYSLDSPGLIYANSGNEGFDHGKYTTFQADEDGIVPFTDTEWFDDDACNRLAEFIAVAWPSEGGARLEENLDFLAANLKPKKNESSRETLRRYLCNTFFKDHLKTYKKRPIYWLFNSGKQKAFQCLVYLHRYNEGTLARMRSEYVIPLQGKMASRIEKLQGDIDAATSTAQANRLRREMTKLEKQDAELRTFDEKLRHYADMKITLDLDDGVKVNYGKFGDLLAEVQAVHGKKAEVS